ncbi:hypothetical protein EMGBD1_18210 [Anaerolineaceae bacterium]|nr:hypothetical protein EMGBD1_18210 [Anaerolineaceae bacterium]
MVHVPARHSKNGCGPYKILGNIASAQPQVPHPNLQGFGN